MCCLETPQVIILSEYFSEKKELANSFRVSGNPLGGAVVPFVLVLLFEAYGVQLSFIILSGIFFQLLVFLFLIRPIKTHQMIVYNSSKKGDHYLDEAQEADESLAMEAEESSSSKPQEMHPPKAKKIDFKLLRNPLYWTHIAMITFFSIALPHMQYFMPLYGKSINLTPFDNSVILGK